MVGKKGKEGKKKKGECFGGRSGKGKWERMKKEKKKKKKIIRRVRVWRRKKEGKKKKKKKEIWMKKK